MSGAEDFARSLRSAATLVGRLRDRLAVAREHGSAAAGHLATALQGTSNPDAEAAVEGAARGARTIDEALRLVDRGADRLAEYAADVLGDPRPTTPGWARAPDLPPTTRDVAEQLRARPAGTNRPTVGYLGGRRLESGGRERALAQDLRHDPLRGPPVTFYQHVESKAAARMRQDDVREAELVMDNTVCGSTERDQAQPWSCDRILPSILPAGSRLTVWATRDGGRTWWRRTYLGTGERIVR